MKKVGIVLLNYLNYKDTMECVESLKSNLYNEKKIIIVDNNSNNESWKILNEKFKNKKDIFLIRSDKNLGFANGNNLGIKFAREKLNCEFVLLANNDTIFKDKNLILELINAYEEGVAVIGPKIISADNINQNPIALKLNRQQVEEELNEMESISHRIKTSYLWIKLKKMNLIKSPNKSNDGNNLVKKESNIDDEFYNKEYCSENLILHGACFMLTEDYFKYYDKLYPKTFLYYEEFILTLITEKAGLKKKYIPDAWIYHKEDQSSLMSFQNISNIREKYLRESTKLCNNLFEKNYDEIIKDFV